MKRSSFLAGVVATLLVVAMGTTALAASGKVTFSFANVALNGETKIEAGKEITVANGQKVPGSILYTDVAGGKTNYLPIRAISDLLGVEIDYDSATQTVHLITKSWQRVVEDEAVTYTCGEENNTYEEPPTYRPVWEEAGWGLVAMRHDTRNYTASWEYENGDQEIVFKCAYPSTAGFSSYMSSETVVNDYQKISVQGEEADYYEDGEKKLLVWENRDGVLFFVRSENVSKETLLSAAESVKNCTATVKPLNLGWLPSGAYLMDYYAIADTVMEYWVLDDVAMSFTCSAEPSGLPAGTAQSVEVNGVDAEYWAAEEPYVDSESTTTVNGQKAENVGGVFGFTIPSAKAMNTLAWCDPDTGTYCRLQSVLDMDTMIRIAKSAN